MEYTLKDGENCKNYENIRRERERERGGGWRPDAAACTRRVTVTSVHFRDYRN